jgi:phage terminase large subunit-like protein
MRYEFKVVEEIALGAFVAAVVFFLSDVAIRSDFTDWQTWLPVLGAGCARAAAGAALAGIVKIRGR